MVNVILKSEQLVFEYSLTDFQIGCPSCGSQVGGGTLISPTSNFGGTIKRAPSAAPSYFAQSAVRGKPIYLDFLLF